MICIKKYFKKSASTLPLCQLMEKILKAWFPLSQNTNFPWPVDTIHPMICLSRFTALLLLPLYQVWDQLRSLKTTSLMSPWWHKWAQGNDALYVQHSPHFPSFFPLLCHEVISSCSLARTFYSMLGLSKSVSGMLGQLLQFSSANSFCGAPTV